MLILSRYQNRGLEPGKGIDSGSGTIRTLTVRRERGYTGRRDLTSRHSSGIPAECRGRSVRIGTNTDGLESEIVVEGRGDPGLDQLSGAIA